MNADEVIAALRLPSGAKLNQRVPKKTLVEFGAPTAADKRLINNGVEEVTWVASLKPSTIGVIAFSDSNREYLEIALLSVRLRAGANSARMAELLHRAIPYPLLLLITQAEELSLSVAHLRWSLAESQKTVLEDGLLLIDRLAAQRGTLAKAFLAGISLTAQPRDNLYEFYQGWVNCVLALKAARITGKYKMNPGMDAALKRHKALLEFAGLEKEIVSLRKTARKEKQPARLVELNAQLKFDEIRMERIRQTL